MLALTSVLAILETIRYDVHNHIGIDLLGLQFADLHQSLGGKLENLVVSGLSLILGVGSEHEG